MNPNRILNYEKLSLLDCCAYRHLEKYQFHYQIRESRGNLRIDWTFLFFHTVVNTSHFNFREKI